MVRRGAGWVEGSDRSSLLLDRLVNWIHSNLFVLGGVALGLAIPQVTYPVKLRFHNSVKTPLVWGRAPGTQAVTLLKGRC